MSDASRPGRNILVTGAQSGLGNAVHRAFGVIAFTRASSLDDPAIKAAAPFDAIMHCAFNAAKDVTMSNAYAYMADNLLLTQQLVAIPHRRFVFISTLAV